MEDLGFEPRSVPLQNPNDGLLMYVLPLLGVTQAKQEGEEEGRVTLFVWETRGGRGQGSRSGADRLRVKVWNFCPETQESVFS